MQERKYKCNDCGERFNSRSLSRAQEAIERCEELTQRMEPLWEEYVKLAAEREDEIQILRQYKRRGIIRDYPHYQKPKLAEALSNYRKEKAGK